MTELRPHHRQDPDALLELVRQARRRDDRTTLEQATDALIALIDTAEPRAAGETVERIVTTLVTLGQRAALTRHVVEQLDRHARDDASEPLPPEARSAVSGHLSPIVRLLAELPDDASQPPPGKLALPTPIALYLRLLRWLHPHDWFDWLGRHPEIARVDVDRGGRHELELRTLLTRLPWAPTTLPEHALLVVRLAGHTELRPLELGASPPPPEFASRAYQTRLLPALDPIDAAQRRAIPADVLTEHRMHLTRSLLPRETLLEPTIAANVSQAVGDASTAPDDWHVEVPPPIEEDDYRKLATIVVCAVFGGLVSYVIGETWLPSLAWVFGLAGGVASAVLIWRLPFYEGVYGGTSYYR